MAVNVMKKQQVKDSNVQFEMIHQGFKIVLVRNLVGEMVFRTYGARKQQVFADQQKLDLAQDQINVYIRSSLKYPPQTFTKWIEQVVGGNWTRIQQQATAARRNAYYEQYKAYCKVNFFPVDFDFEF